MYSTFRERNKQVFQSISVALSAMQSPALLALRSPIKTIAIGKPLAGSITSGVMATFPGIRLATCGIKPIGFVLQGLFNGRINLRNYESSWSEERTSSTNTNLKSYKDGIVITNDKSTKTKRRRGNKAGSNKNSHAMYLTEKAFDRLLEIGKQYLIYLTREPIGKIIKEWMVDSGLPDDNFHYTYFREIYRDNKDVNHKAGNHHGKKNNPEIILQIRKMLSLEREIFIV